MTPNWFIALPVPCDGWLEPALESSPEFVRRFRPDDVHLTIAFLGACSESEAFRAWDAARAIRIEPFVAELTQLQPFGKRVSPSAFSATLGDGREIASTIIAKHREAILAAAALPPDSRPPRPHVTIARPPRRASKRQREEAKDWAASVRLNARVNIDTIALYTWSELRPRRQFDIVDQRPLNAPGEALAEPPAEPKSEDAPKPRRKRIR